MDVRSFKRFGLAGIIAAVILTPQLIFADTPRIFKVGQKVSITENGVRVRYEPAGVVRATLDAGTIGTVLKSPGASGRILRGQKDYTWWNVDFGMFTGWVAADYLELVTISPPTPTTARVVGISLDNDRAGSARRASVSVNIGAVSKTVSANGIFEFTDVAVGAPVTITSSLANAGDAVEYSACVVPNGSTEPVGCHTQWYSSLSITPQADKYTSVWINHIPRDGTVQPSTMFSVGDQVDVTQNGVNLRGAAAGTMMRTMNRGNRGVIKESPATPASLSSGSYQWWKTDFGYGIVGWIAQNYLAKSIHPPVTTPPPVTPPPSSGTTPICQLNGVTGDSAIVRAVGTRFEITRLAQNADYLHIAAPGWHGPIDCGKNADGTIQAAYVNQPAYTCRDEFLRSRHNSSFNLPADGKWGNLYMREEGTASITVKPMKNDGTSGSSCKLVITTERAPVTPPPVSPPPSSSSCSNNWNRTSGGYYDGDGSGATCRCDYFNSSGQSPFSPSPSPSCFPVSSGTTSPPPPVAVTPPPVTPPPSAGQRINIQGLLYEKTATHPRVAGTVTLSGGGSVTTRIDNQTYSGCSIKANGACMNGSFVWSNLLPGQRTVTLTLPSGFASAEWSVCYDAVGACHDTAVWTAGTTATINASYNSYADVWFRLIRSSSSQPSPVVTPSPPVAVTPPPPSDDCHGIELNTLMPNADAGWYGKRDQDINPGQPVIYCVRVTTQAMVKVRFDSYEISDAQCGRAEMTVRKIGAPASQTIRSGVVSSPSINIFGEGSFLNRLPIPPATYEMTMTDHGALPGCRRNDIAWKAF